ncbi:MAG: sterol desaturase family protein [Caulobacterales bacterium]
MIGFLTSHWLHTRDMYLGELARYAIGAGMVFAVVLVWRRLGVMRFRIHERFGKFAQMRREAINAVVSLVCFQTAQLGVAAVALDLSLRFHGRAPQSLWFLAISIPLIIFAHDTYFYWSHRVMHLKPLFRWVHLEHHKSLAPTPWAAYSFSIPEAVVQGSFLPLYTLFVPVAKPVLIFFLVAEIAHNAMIHSGIEFFPRWMVSHRRFGWWAGVTHHDLHHGTTHSNFGLYFRFWDRLMGTEHRDFVAVYEYVRAPQNDGRAFRLLSRAPAK